MEAADWAAAEAALHGVQLRLVYASLWEHYERIKPAFSPDRASERVLAEHIMASAADRAERLAPDVKVSTEIVPEDPVSALLGEGRHAFAVVIGNRGRGELIDQFLGSTSLTVAARATCPVVVVRGSRSAGPAVSQRVVLGVGDRDEASAAAEFAFQEAELRGGTLDAVRAWRGPAAGRHGTGPRDGAGADDDRRQADETLRLTLTPLAERHGRVTVQQQAVDGSARKALLESAAGAGLLVVGARRRHGVFGLQLGPVNHAVLHHAPCPVAVVPQ